MIYLFLKPFVKSWSLANFFSYISVRTFLALSCSLLIWLLLGEYFIGLLKKFQKSGSRIRDLGQAGKVQKEHTPTAGGIFIIYTIIFNVCLWCDLTNVYIQLLIFVAISQGLLGFCDDFFKLRERTYNGIKPITKLTVHIFISLVAYIVLIKFLPQDIATSINIPFLKDCMLNLGIFYIFFVFCVISGSSNAVNLSDGLDGLATGPIIITTACMLLLCYISGHMGFAKYLYVPFIPGSSEIVVFCGALFGSCLGFLWYNAYPAALFMGDTGSLAIGGILGTIALIIKQELVFALVAFVFVWEALSVIIQVFYYKKNKKRIFLMAPFHHHLEKKGWSETQIVIRSWIASFLFALIGLACIKLR